jgi:hypothetical protein
MATSHAFSYPSAILIGWMPRSSNDNAEDNRAPAKTDNDHREHEHHQPSSSLIARLTSRRQRLQLTDDTSSPIPNLIILALTDLYQQLGDLVLDLHLTEDRRSVVGHGDIAIGGDEDLVQSSGSERGFDDVGD